MKRFHGKFFSYQKQDEQFYRESFEFNGVKYDVYETAYFYLYFGTNPNKDYFIFPLRSSTSLIPPKDLEILLKLKGYDI